jgi:hypothetical protein
MGGSLLLCSRLAAAECSPQRMVKAVYVNLGPDIDKASSAAQPKTLYRLGSSYGRVEEDAQAATGLHQLMVVNERDVWTVNLVNNEGTHYVNQGDTGQFRAPLFIDADGSPFLTSLEFGCEVASIRAAGAPRPRRVEVAGQRLDRYDVTRGGESIMLLAEPGTDLPYAIGFYRDGSTVFGIRYIEYSNSLSPNLALFERPSGVTFTDAQ